MTNVDGASCGGVPPVARFSFDPQFISPGETSTVELSIQNLNDSPLTLDEGEIIASIPVGVTPESSAVQSCTEIPASIQDGGSTLLMEGGNSLPGDFQCDITFDVSSTETGSYTFELPAGEIQSDRGENQNDAIGTLYVVPSDFVDCQLDDEALLGYTCECQDPDDIFLEEGICANICEVSPDDPSCSQTDATDGGGDGDGGPGGDVTDGTGDGADSGDDAIDPDAFDTDDAIDPDAFDTDDAIDPDGFDANDDAETIDDVTDAETSQDATEDTVTPDASTDVEDDVSAPDVEDDATTTPDTDDDPGDVLTDDRVRMSGGGRFCASTSGGAGSMGLSFMVLIGLFWRGRRNDS